MEILNFKEWNLLKDVNFECSWDYKYPQNNANFYGKQEDWNQTLLTKINQVSAEIHKSNWNGGADAICVNESIFGIIKTLEYFDEKTMKIGSRFDVIVTNEITSDSIFVYSRQEKNIKSPAKKNINSGIIKILNFSNPA